MSSLQLVKTKTKTKTTTKTKQAFQADEVQEQILESLTIEQVLEFIQELSKKTLAKKKAEDLARNKIKSKNKTLPTHIRQGIKESLEAYNRGKFTTLNTKEELFNHFEKISH